MRLKNAIRAKIEELNSLEACISECLKQPELLTQYRRLNKISGEMDDKDWFKFFNFIKKYIFKPLKRNAKNK
jgi:hypothetical protein